PSASLPWQRSRAREPDQADDRPGRSASDPDVPPPGHLRPRHPNEPDGLGVRGVAEGYRPRRVDGRRARRDPQGTGTDLLDSGPRRQGPEDQLPGSALQDEARWAAGRGAAPASGGMGGRIAGGMGRAVGVGLSAVLTLAA